MGDASAGAGVVGKEDQGLAAGGAAMEPEGQHLQEQNEDIRS